MFLTHKIHSFSTILTDILHRRIVLCIQKTRLPRRYVNYRTTKTMFSHSESACLPQPFLPFPISVWAERSKRSAQTLMNFRSSETRIFHNAFSSRGLRKSSNFALFSRKLQEKQNVTIPARQGKLDFNNSALTGVNGELWRRTICHLLFVAMRIIV